MDDFDGERTETRFAALVPGSLPRKRSQGVEVHLYRIHNALMSIRLCGPAIGLSASYDEWHALVETTCGFEPFVDDAHTGSLLRCRNWSESTVGRPEAALLKLLHGADQSIAGDEVAEHSAGKFQEPECTGTSVTLLTKDLHYNSLAVVEA
jgi:hypothetical protein